MTTKEKIAYEALTLFSIKGFTAVSIRDIGRAVGIKESSIYNHYKNKQDILDSIVAEHMSRAEGLFQVHVPEINEKGSMNFLSGEELAELLGRVFREYLADEYLMKFYRLLTIEQYNSPYLRELHDKHFYICPITSLEQSFAKLKEMGAFIDEMEPQAAALQFYSPIGLIFAQAVGKADTEIERFMQDIENHVIQFCAIYMK